MIYRESLPTKIRAQSQTDSVEKHRDYALMKPQGPLDPTLPKAYSLPKFLHSPIFPLFELSFWHFSQNYPNNQMAIYSC